MNLSKIKFTQRLAYKLVIYYGLVLAIFISLAFQVERLDARKFSPLASKDQIYFENETINTAKVLNLDTIFEKKMFAQTASGYDIILEELESGNLVGVNQSNLRPLQFFIFQAQKADSPLQHRFESSEIYGPFEVKTKNNTFNQYFIKAVEPQQKWMNYIFDSPFIMVIMLMIIGIPLLLLMAMRITRPVKRLTEAANAVAIGNLETNPKLEDEDIYELREVGKSFNHMIASLNALKKNQQRMISDISHELKTPLARLQLSAAILNRKIGEMPEISRIENEIIKIDTMVKDLLTVSRQEINFQTEKSIFSIDKIWKDILEDAKFEVNQGGIILTIRQNIQNPENYTINGSHESLAKALENLIRNAKKYAKKQVFVSINVRNDLLNFIIEDDGDGIPEGEYEKIFAPFYRVDEARDRKTGGTGLGLAIVQNAIQQHQGKIFTTKSSLGGLKMQVQIPLWTGTL